MRAVDKKHQRAIDDMTQQISDHQAAGKQQKRRPGLDPDAIIGFDKYKEGEAVGQDAHGHGDDGGGDRQLFVAAGAVAGSDL